MAEKDEEYDSTRKNFIKALESMQAATEVETKAKGEALRIRKKMESDVLELETSLEHSNAGNIESQKNIKRYHAQIREVQGRLEEEQKVKEAAHDHLITADRKAHSNQNALEEARTLLEQADRARRSTEQELLDSSETLGELTCQNQALYAAKRKLEAEQQTLYADLDEMSAEVEMADGKAQKAMVDAARLADELRGEQEQNIVMDRNRKIIEAQVKDMQGRLDDAEQNALKGGKKVVQRLESRIRELETEIDNESRRMADAQKNLRRSERRIKELSFQGDEDRKNHEMMQHLIDQLQVKIKSYKKSIEEAEEIAAQNLAKFRMVQNSLLESQERADLTDKSLAKAKAMGRGKSATPAPMRGKSSTPAPRGKSLTPSLVPELE